jgi:hypothetical protein
VPEKRRSMKKNENLLSSFEFSGAFLFSLVVGSFPLLYHWKKDPEGDLILAFLVSIVLFYCVFRFAWKVLLNKD